MTQTSRSGLNKYLGNAIKILLTVVVLYFLFFQIEKHWADIKDFNWQLDYLYLVLSIVTGLVTLVLFSLIWRWIIFSLGHQVSPAKSFRIFYISNLGRYIPGKVWQLFGILYLAKKEGIPPEDATASFVLAQLYALPASFLIYILMAQFETEILIDQIAIFGPQSSMLIFAFMLLVSFAIIFFPEKILSFGNIVLRKFSRPEVKFNPDKKVALKLFVGYSIAWVGYGAAFWLFLQAVIPDSKVGLFASIGIFNAAYQLGYLALFAPGGFGPREIIMGMLLTPFVGAIAPAVAIMARLWSIVIESIAATMALFVKK